MELGSKVFTAMSMLHHRPAIHINQILRWCAAITTVSGSFIAKLENFMHVRRVLSAAAFLGIVATLIAAAPGDPPTARGRGAGAGRGRGGPPAAQAQTPNAAEV